MDRDMRTDIIDGDAKNAIAFQSAKKDLDPMFFLTYELDESRKL